MFPVIIHTKPIKGLTEWEAPPLKPCLHVETQPFRLSSLDYFVCWSTLAPCKKFSLFSFLFSFVSACFGPVLYVGPRTYSSSFIAFLKARLPRSQWIWKTRTKSLVLFPSLQRAEPNQAIIACFISSSCFFFAWLQWMVYIIFWMCTQVKDQNPLGSSSSSEIESLGNQWRFWWRSRRNQNQWRLQNGWSARCENEHMSFSFLFES